MMKDMKIKIHVLRTGEVRVSPYLPANLYNGFESRACRRTASSRWPRMIPMCNPILSNYNNHFIYLITINVVTFLHGRLTEREKQ